MVETKLFPNIQLNSYPFLCAMPLSLSKCFKQYLQRNIDIINLASITDQGNFSLSWGCPLGKQKLAPPSYIIHHIHTPPYTSCAFFSLFFSLCAINVDALLFDVLQVFSENRNMRCEAKEMWQFRNQMKPNKRGQDKLYKAETTNQSRR